MIFKHKDTSLPKISKKNATFEQTACSKLGRDKLMNSNPSKSRNFCLKPSAERQVFQAQSPRDPEHQGTSAWDMLGVPQQEPKWDMRG